jgi:hypothetical protein
MTEFIIPTVSARNVLGDAGTGNAHGVAGQKQQNSKLITGQVEHGLLTG